MPISPENRVLYPANWREISQRIRARAGGRCECTGECGLHQPKETPCHECLLEGPSFECKHCGGTGRILSGLRRCSEMDGARASFAEGRIILTVAHLNHDPRDSRPENLLAMCQRCHNRLDVPHRRKNAAATRRAKLNNLELFAEGQ